MNGRIAGQMDRYREINRKIDRQMNNYIIHIYLSKWHYEQFESHLVCAKDRISKIQVNTSEIDKLWLKSFIISSLVVKKKFVSK